MAARLLVVCLSVLLATATAGTLANPTNSTRRLNLFGWHLELEKNDDMQSQECTECRFYKGRVLSEDASMAMVTECDGRWYGLVQVGDEVFLLPKREGHVMRKRDAMLALVEENLSLFDLTGDTLPAPADLDLEEVTKARIHTRSSQATHEDYFKYGLSDSAAKSDSRLWLELVVVADQTMLKFHGDARKVRHYILALMNIVSAIFNDRSLSAGMTIVVSQIHVFDRYDPTHIRSGSMQEKLRRVNQWNTKQLLKTYASSRWDALVWLTRTEVGAGSPAGIALPDGVCSLNHSATLQRDAGFTSAFVIAHELGHLLGMRHDDEWKYCARAASGRGGRVKTIMNSLVLASLDFSWSQCSRDTFHEKARKWRCLQERSGVDGVEVGGRKYHSEYSMDQQCRVAFGQGYSTCKLKMDSPPCSVLYCTHELDPGSCISKNNGEPPLEGTPCKKDHWCTGGECRLMPGLQTSEENLPEKKLPERKLPEKKLPIGKLSPELKREPCAASCGYGLRKISGHCADGGATCETDTRVESCWSGRRCARARDERADLCRHISDAHLPYVHRDSSKQCELWCVDRHGGEPYRVGVLPTGTPCGYKRPYDICFNGDCVPGNCDPTDQDCNACADGRCRNHTSTMRPQLFDDDLHWTSLVIVPRGVHQFTIRITTPSPIDVAITTPASNYTLKLKYHSGLQVQGNHLKYDISVPQSLRFVPLGDDAMDLGEDEEQRMEGRMVVAGTVVEWTQSDREVFVSSDSPATSSVTFLGRHPKGYSFVVTDVDDIMADTVNVSINYTMVPRKVRRYRGSCSVSCGGGRRLVRTCGRHSCKGKYEPCNMQRCQFSWVAGEWEECSQTCGTAGLQERQLYCVPDQLRSYSLEVLKLHSVSPELCSEDLVPERQKPCNHFPCPVYWQELPWTECSATCGPGQQHRPLVCPAEEEILCGPKPVVRRQVCRRARCKTQWHRRSDSKDSKDCGLYADRQLRMYCGLPYFRRRCSRTCHEMDT